jgi:hypothetical protein
MAYSAFWIVLWLMQAGLGMRWRMPLACSGERPRRRASLTLPHRVLPSTILRTTRACADQTLGTQLGFDAAVAARCAKATGPAQIGCRSRRHCGERTHA